MALEDLIYAVPVIGGVVERERWEELNTPIRRPDGTIRQPVEVSAVEAVTGAVTETVGGAVEAVGNAAMSPARTLKAAATVGLVVVGALAAWGIYRATR